MKNSLAVLKLSIFTVWAVILSFIGYFTLHPYHAPCANSISCVNDLSGNYENSLTYATFMGSTYPVPSEKTPVLARANILGDTTASNKRIEVDLTNQRLYAYEGDTMIHNFLISSGKWGKTPTGTFRIWIKLRYTRMTGGVKGTGTYYDLPNVPYTMFFYNDQIPKYRGYGIHGAYWHNNFGHPMSHGCINMKNEEAEILYNWAQPTSVKGTTYATEEDPGTPIIIYGTAPNY